jgi:N-acyl-L-homoserine lactone synthetase
VFHYGLALSVVRIVTLCAMVRLERFAGNHWQVHTIGLGQSALGRYYLP